LWFIVALVVLLLAAIGGYALFARRSSPERQMNEAISAMQSGRREAARGAFSEVARDHPDLATPHIFLSRMSREEGDLVTARRELETAIRLDPKNPVALREVLRAGASGESRRQGVDGLSRVRTLAPEQV
jgi:cytochrome c-type biogenesis protein CcmH/NrfG